jgi:hypothetical protein
MIPIPTCKEEEYENSGNNKCVLLAMANDVDGCNFEINREP